MDNWFVSRLQDLTYINLLVFSFCAWQCVSLFPWSNIALWFSLGLARRRQCWSCTIIKVSCSTLLYWWEDRGAASTLSHLSLHLSFTFICSHSLLPSPHFISIFHSTLIFISVHSFHWHVLLLPLSKNSPTTNSPPALLCMTSCPLFSLLFSAATSALPSFWHRKVK